MGSHRVHVIKQNVIGPGVLLSIIGSQLDNKQCETPLSERRGLGALYAGVFRHLRCASCPSDPPRLAVTRAWWAQGAHITPHKTLEDTLTHCHERLLD